MRLPSRGTSAPRTRWSRCSGRGTNTAARLFFPPSINAVLGFVLLVLLVLCGSSSQREFCVSL